MQIKLCVRKQYVKELTICKQMSQNSFKNVTYKVFVYKSDIFNMHKQNLVLNNQQDLIWRKNTTNKLTNYLWFYYYKHSYIYIGTLSLSLSLSLSLFHSLSLPLYLSMYLYLSPSLCLSYQRTWPLLTHWKTTTLVLEL